MRILALDSSGMTASVAVVDEDKILAEYTVDYKKTHSQTLLPMLDTIAQMVDLDLTSIDAIAVAGGPGSFTGLRIGSATAKGLGLALEKPLIHIPTVDAMAFNLYGSECYVCPMMDARRKQVYTGIYHFEEDRLIVDMEQDAISIEDLIEQLNRLNKRIIILGDGVPVHQKTLEEQLKVPFSFAPAHRNRQSAASVGTLAFQYMKEGKMETAAEHKPDYLRLSQAERERQERLQKEQGEQL